MEKMDKEVKEAVKELLEKIPEDKLSEAVGGLDTSVKNILIYLGLIGVSAGISVGGLYVNEKSKGESFKNKAEEYLSESSKSIENLDKSSNLLQTSAEQATKKLDEFIELSKKLAQQLEEKKP